MSPTMGSMARVLCSTQVNTLSASWNENTEVWRQQPIEWIKISIQIISLHRSFSLVWYNILGIVHCTYTYLGVSHSNFKKKYCIYCLKILSTLTNSVDPDEMQRNAAFHLGLHCFQKYLFMGSRKSFVLWLKQKVVFELMLYLLSQWIYIYVRTAEPILSSED